MKRTKRQENAIVVNLVLFFILFIIFLATFVLYIIPNITAIEWLKKETKESISTIQTIEKKGIWFGDFKKITSGNLSDFIDKEEATEGKEDYISGVVKSVDQVFYDESFLNNTDVSYTEFLSQLSEEQKKLNEETQEKLLVLSTILPAYSENINEIEGEDLLTDFKFINYVESIFSAFNLAYDNSVGIENLTILPNYVIGIWNDSMDRNIFYIPMEFDLVGSKSSIINFLHFLQNIWKVSIEKPTWEDGEGDLQAVGELKIYDETYERGDYFYDFKNIRLANNIQNKNIFNNQIFTIESISFNDYINSSFDTKEGLSLLEFLKSTNQLPEKFSINVKLRFYVKGQPKYKIENFINDFSIAYANTKLELDTLLTNTNLSTSDRQKLQNSKTTLEALSQTINTLKTVTEQNSLNDNYNEAFKYNEYLQEEIKKINKIKEKLWNIVK